jgi:enoyl-CoA hydratase/carnithine racemase
VEQLVALKQATEQVSIVELNHAPVNSWNLKFIDELSAVVERLMTSKDIRCVVITSIQQHFSAGGDFSTFRDFTSSGEMDDFATRVQNLTMTVAALPMPTIAAVNGHALGGGFELALACDLRIASPEARFGLPETRWGILPGAGGTQRLSRLTSPSFAKQLMLTAQPVTASECYRTGAVDIISDDKDCLPKALEIAQHIASNSPTAIQATKKCIDAVQNTPLNQALRQETMALIQLLRGDEFQEGITAFWEKRDPLYVK